MCFLNHIYLLYIIWWIKSASKYFNWVLVHSKLNVCSSQLQRDCHCRCQPLVPSRTKTGLVLLTAALLKWPKMPMVLRSRPRKSSLPAKGNSTDSSEEQTPSSTPPSKRRSSRLYGSRRRYRMHEVSISITQLFRLLFLLHCWKKLHSQPRSYLANATAATSTD